jgi:hypothetical protein
MSKTFQQEPTRTIPKYLHPRARLEEFRKHEWAYKPAAGAIPEDCCLQEAVDTSPEESGD